MATPNRSEESRRRELLELEHAFWNATKVRDGKSAARLADTTSLMVSAQGIHEVPQDALADLTEAAPYTLDYFSIDPDKVQIKMIDDHVAVIAYEVDEKVTIDGKQETVHAYETSVWVRKVGKWVCALHAEALAGDAFGRDRVTH